METSEHKQVGDQIRIETLGNHYLRGSKDLSLDPTNNLKVRMMHSVDGIPVPLDPELSAGDFVMAADYFTKAGWGYELTLPPQTGDVVADNEALFEIPISAQESRAFREAYEDLASPTVKRSDIDEIYRIENKTYIPFVKSLNSLFQQAVYYFAIKDYGNKLNLNVAHFTPWSTRAYLVGHESALRMATLAFYFKQLAEGKPGEIPEDYHDELNSIIQKIKAGGDYHFTEAQLADNQAIFTELWQRYHALAVSRDLFIMHFYSDHFAGGHMGRIGLLRETMPKKFGFLGGILINNMHNEDNTDSVTVTPPYDRDSDAYTENRDDSQAYGDGTYSEKRNDNTANLLINGMDNSLGDIARLMTTGERPDAKDYGGLTFLPAIDYTKPQPPPLLIYGPDQKIYFREEISKITKLSPQDYRNTLADPAGNGYKELTYFQAAKLVLKLRVFGFFYSPTPVKPEVKLGISLRPKAAAPVRGAEHLVKINDSTAQTEPTFTGEHRGALRRSFGEQVSHSLLSPPKDSSDKERVVDHQLATNYGC
ncbi:Dot/Icm secretion system substrate [Legionella nautarum]|uniref:Dot/Icm secretion system substrate n=1 Tax=Legionella nautarum TaxID=45070 RepID=A0A0W0X2T6_9GAMM|nr:hypothetical protein [Legionella nautarum]KTD38842.1 Dot/Icm secretion system substrate [Legionella nautarum]